eukprot:gene36351-47314_t
MSEEDVEIFLHKIYKMFESDVDELKSYLVSERISLRFHDWRNWMPFDGKRTLKADSDERAQILNTVSVNKETLMKTVPIPLLGSLDKSALSLPIISEGRKLTKQLIAEIDDYESRQQCVTLLWAHYSDSRAFFLTSPVSDDVCDKARSCISDGEPSPSSQRTKKKKKKGRFREMGGAVIGYMRFMNLAAFRVSLVAELELQCEPHYVAEAAV